MKMAQCIECSRAECREYGSVNKPRWNARLRSWRSKNPEAARAKDRRARLMSLYGLREAEVERLLATHDGKCWLCLASIRGSALAWVFG